MYKWNVEQTTLPRNSGVIIFPLPIGIMEQRMKACRFSGFVPIYLVTSLVMFTAPPKTTLVETTDILNVKTNVLVLILLCINLITLLWTTHLMMTRRRRKLPHSSYLIMYMKNAWNSTVLFFCEPYDKVHKSLAIRLATGAWIIGVTFITIQGTSYMKSEFAVTSHDLIHSVEDLTRHPDVIPLVPKNSAEERQIKILAKSNLGFRYVLDKLNTDENFLTVEDHLNANFYKTISNKKVVFLSQDILIIAIGFSFNTLKTEDADILFISPPVADTYMVFPFSEVIERNYKDKVNLFFLDHFETQWSTFYNLKYHYVFDYLKWRPSSQGDAVIVEVEEIRSIIIIYLYGCLFSLMITIIEILFKTCKDYYMFAGVQR